MSGYEISADRERLDVDLIHRYLSEESYWARGRTREVVERSIENSLCLGAYVDGGEQVGFARVVTDRSTFAWLADVFVVEAHRGRGVGKLLVEAAIDDPGLTDVYRWLLGTADAHGLYGRYGFRAIRKPERLMAIEADDEADRCAGG